MAKLLFYFFITLVHLLTKSLCQQTPQIPDIFGISLNGAKIAGYKIDWEVSAINGTNPITNTNIGTTYSVTEYYDIVNRRGRLDIVEAKGVNGTFIYNAITTEAFHLNQGTCSLLTTNQKPAFLSKIVEDYVTQNFAVDRKIFGPSVYLRMIFTNQNVQYVSYSSPDKRYFKGNLWNANFGNNRLGWVFSNPTDPNPYGLQNMALPIWVGIDTMTNGVYKRTKVYEVAKFTPFYQNTMQYISDKFSIPVGFGCGRLPAAVANAPKPPVLKGGFSYDMKLEVVMNPYNKYNYDTKESNPVNLVDNGRLTYDVDSQMMAWRYEGFNVTGSITGSYYDDGNNNNFVDSKPLKGNELKNPTRTVWDIRAGVVYVMDDGFDGGCVIKQKQTNDFLASISFKAGYKIPINAPELIQNSDFVYMGEFIERGVVAMVYERKVNKTFAFGKTILNRTTVFTHYFKKDNYSNSYIANNMLLRINIAILTPYTSNGAVYYTQVWNAVINVNEFTIKLPIIDVWSHIKQQVFNVKNCFLQKGLSNWFQLGFPITNGQYIKLYQQADSIDRQILSYLFTADDMGIPPTRIPNSLIGWTSNTLYWSALMLERPPFLLDFLNISNGPQRLKKVSRQFAVQSVSDCAGTCLDLDSRCNYFSICSNFMCILGDTLDPFTKPEMIASINCTTYQKKPEKLYNGLTMKRMLNLIKNKTLGVKNNANQLALKPFSLNLYITNSSDPLSRLETIKLTAVQFKSGFSFGQMNSLNNEIILNDERYKMKAVTHFKQSSNKGLTLVQATSFLNCRQKCDDFNNNTCHSFSYCTSTQECILSTFHAEEMIDSNFNKTYEQKSDCALLYRHYINDYTRLGIGVMTTQRAAKAYNVPNEEECAVKCSKEPTFKCKSFEICASSEGPAIAQNCYLHKTHRINDLSINESMPLNLSPQFVHCAHFSRNYASDYDYRSNMNYAYIDGQNRIRITDLTVEQCAKRCSENQSKRKCLGFSYCQGKLVNSLKPQPICVISPTNDRNNTVYYQTDNNCQIFFNGRLSFQLIKVTDDSGKSSTYSSGAGAGVGIFMLLLGGFLAVVGIIVYNKRKAALNNV